MWFNTTKSTNQLLFSQILWFSNPYLNLPPLSFSLSLFFLSTENVHTHPVVAMSSSTRAMPRKEPRMSVDFWELTAEPVTCWLQPTGTAVEQLVVVVTVEVCPALLTVTLRVVVTVCVCVRVSVRPACVVVTVTVGPLTTVERVALAQ